MAPYHYLILTYQILVLVLLGTLYITRRYLCPIETASMPKAKKTDIIKSPAKTPYEKTGPKKAGRTTAKDAASSGEYQQEAKV